MSASPPVLPSIPSNITFLTGPPLMGILVNWGLYGCLVVQVYIYSQYFIEDRKFIRWLVYGLSVLETAQIALSTANAFQWFSIGFGNMISLSNPFYSPVDTPIIGGATALIVQIFFCWRIRVLGKSWILPGVIGIVSLAQFIGGVASGIRALQIENVTEMQSITVYLVIWLVGSALADTLIAIAMTVLLSWNKSNGLSGGEMARRIVRLTIETNSITAAVAIFSCVSFVVYPKASIFMAPSCSLGKLYSNTLMVNFNNRILLAQTQSSWGRGTSESRFEDMELGRRTRNIVESRAPPSKVSNPDSFKIEIFQGTRVCSDMQIEEYENSKGCHPDFNFNLGKTLK